MITYIKELADTIQLATNNLSTGGGQKIHGHDVQDIHSLLAAFVEELNRLDPRDFEPAARHDFVMLRVALRNWAKGSLSSGKRAAEDANKMNQLLDSYIGEGTGAAARQFPYLTNPDVKKIVERDYRELSQRAFPDGSWKSTVILSGSILEAVLHDVLTKDAGAIAAAMGASSAPNRRGTPKDITRDDYQNQWTLNDLIKVACEMRILPMANEEAIHAVLREYRNLVHPRAEIGMGVFINESHATASKGMLDVCLDAL